MPLIQYSAYRAPRLFSNGHVQTIYPNLFRIVQGITYERQRITTPDDDFLDLDWSHTGSKRVTVLVHGLEGDSRRTYVTGMVKVLNNNGWDTCSLNLRGCSGEINKKPGFYHSGSTPDLKTVIDLIAASGNYESLSLVGFSLGGNITLRYLGESGDTVPSILKRAVAISVPVDLAGSAEVLARPQCRIYMTRFLWQLHEKIKAKKELFPDIIDDSNYYRIKSFHDFDDRYTAPLHGYSSAKDYYKRASSLPVLKNIRVPALLINADNDPFLSHSCYPESIAAESDHFYFEQTRGGGHVGFVHLNGDGTYWSEKRTAEFLSLDDSASTTHGIPG